MRRPPFPQGSLGRTHGFAGLGAGGGGVALTARRPTEMGILHSVLFCNGNTITYYRLELIQQRVKRWATLIPWGTISTAHFDATACTFKMVYNQVSQDMLLSLRASDDNTRCPPLDRRVQKWGSKSTLLFTQQELGELGLEPLEVWAAFRWLHLPWWDLDFICQTLLKQLTTGDQMGHKLGDQMGHKLGT